MKSFLRSTYMFIRIIIILMILAGLLYYGLHTVLTRYETLNNPQPGLLVNIDNQQMHVYIQGDGEETLILLSGLGTVAPAVDFKPLINELSDDYTVVVVEGFGYGWSDETDQSRTVENIVEELRQALDKAHIAPPYILVPHSYSGIYSLYYAHHYPTEIKAIIGNDCSMPTQWEYFEGEYPRISPWMASLAPMGIARLMMWIAPSGYMPDTTDNIYTRDDLHMIKMISG